MSRSINPGEASRRVMMVQEYLGHHGYPVEQSGEFGEETYAAVMHFQMTHGLVTDGIVGPRTWIALTGHDGPPVQSVDHSGC